MQISQNQQDEITKIIVDVYSFYHSAIALALKKEKKLEIKLTNQPSILYYHFQGGGIMIAPSSEKEEYIRFKSSQKDNYSLKIVIDPNRINVLYILRKAIEKWRFITETEESWNPESLLKALLDLAREILDPSELSTIDMTFNQYEIYIKITPSR